MTDQFLYADPKKQQALMAYVEDAVIGLAQRAKLEEADAQGILVDPNVPITPEPPEVPPPMPQGMPMPGGQPPMPPQGGAPVQAPVDPQGAVMSNLLPGM